MRVLRKKVGVARLKLTRDDNSKGTRIGPSLFYTTNISKNLNSRTVRPTKNKPTH